MRRRWNRTLWLLAGVAVLAGCVGEAARERALLPALRQAWGGVRADALAGGARGADLTAMDEALAAGEPRAVQRAWPAVQAAARAALADMSPGLAEFRGHRIEKFNEAVEALNGHGK